MSHYQEVENYLLEHQLDQSLNDEKFEVIEHPVREVGSGEQPHNDFLPSVRKFLSQPNPLMNKIQFTPYHPKCYYPRALGRLPKCLKDYSCIMTEKNNMNSLSQALHGHQRLKRDNLDTILNKNKKSSQNKTHLVTLQEYYSNKQPFYERYSAQQMKLQQTKLKLRYFATYVLDMAKVLRKQVKFQKQHQVNLNTQFCTNQHNSVAISRSGSAARSGNFNIREQKSPLFERPPQSHQSSRKSLHPPRIQFDSNFQSGNLFRAYQKQFNEYDLMLQNDINTKGNTQWFFFSVKNVAKNTTIKFNLVNMSKSASLFNIGMKPYVFSMMRYEKRNVGWIRQGLKVTYEESQNHHKQSSKSPYYVLSFEYKFLYEGDILYFSHSISYTLTDLSQFLNTRLKDKSLHKLLKIKNVGLTLGSNQVDLLQITNSQFLNKYKKSVWIIARQHPGETTSGFMMQGVIDYLLSGSQQAKMLLNNFIFKIVPMVNVDGVIHGSSRAQIIGSDPNRRWLGPHKLHNPIVHSIKHYIQREKDHVEMVLDLHSHSRKLGTFFYGNTMSQNTAATRIFPLYVTKNDQRFTFKSCRFSGGSNNAARYALFNSLKIPLIYTVQCSFYGYQIGNHRIIEYLPSDYKEMGHSLMKGFKDYQVKKNSKNLKLQRPILSQIYPQKQIQDEINQQDFQAESVGSDQDPDEDQYDEKEFKKLITFKLIKKKKKQRKQEKQPTLKIKIAKQLLQPVKRAKQNNSESYYREYFSGRHSTTKKGERILDMINNNLDKVSKKQTVNLGIQVKLKESNRRQSHHVMNPNDFRSILTQRNGQQLLSAKLGNLTGLKNLLLPVNNLCVIGQKVQQISVYGTTVGVQVTQNKQFSLNRNEYDSDPVNNATRKSFSVRQRISSFLQVKQNNFLQRGDCMTKNFFSRA